VDPAQRGIDLRHLTEGLVRAHRGIQLAVLLAALLPVTGGAQEAAPPLPRDPRAPRFAEVERGFFTGFEAGYLMLFNTKTADPARYPYAGQGGGTATGFLAGVSVGYDVTHRFAVSLFALGAGAQGSLNYGSFSIDVIGGDLRLALLGSRDANDVERLYVYVHGRGGYLATNPQGLLGNHDLYLAGGPGIEYFTRLRHFSIGISADVAYLPSAKVPGLAVTPTVRYTF
jgi:hypothetical protein